MLARLDESLAPGGHVVAVHWRGVTDYPLTGDRVHELLDAHDRWRHVVRYRQDAFALAVYERRA